MIRDAHIMREDIADLNILLRSLVTCYLTTNKISHRTYAKEVDVSWAKIYALENGIINITKLSISDISKILDKHGLLLRATAEET